MSKYESKKVIGWYNSHTVRGYSLIKKTIENDMKGSKIIGSQN